MPHYMAQWQFNSSNIKCFTESPQDRSGIAKALIEAFGGKMLCYYFSLGQYDGMAICEFPDLLSASASSMRAVSSGAFKTFETTVLLTAQEAEVAMRKAGSVPNIAPKS